MTTPRDPVRAVASQLGALRQRAVFTGGAAVPLYLDADHAVAVRVTLDVDIVVDVHSRSARYGVEEYLRTLWWTQPML